MEYSLSDFKGHYGCLPDALEVLVGGEAYLMLRTIVRRSRETISNKAVHISKKELAHFAKCSYNTADNYITTLVKLNLINVSGKRGGKLSFTINWTEVSLINDFITKINDRGWHELYKKSHVNNDMPFSEIDEQFLDAIQNKYPSTSSIFDEVEDNKVKTSSISDEVAIRQTPTSSIFDEVNEKDSQFLLKSVTSSNSDEVTSKHHQNLMMSPSTSSISDDVAYQPRQKLMRLEQIIEDIKQLHQKLMRFEGADGELLEIKKILSEHLGDFLQPTSSNSDDVEMQTSSIFDDVASQPRQKLTTSNIYNNIYNKYHNERSSFNIKGEKENKIQDWFYSRDLSFPALSSDEFNSIFELPDFNDDDASKAIRLVWDSLNYDSTSQDNYIPADMFKDVLFRAWNQLKEDSQDFSLSEQDMKNIFAFDLIEQDGEFFCEITPSNIKNISSTSQESPRSQKKSKHESRTSRNIFIECIREIGEKDDKLLTDAEFAIQLMIDYIQDTSKGHSAITSKLMYENLLQDFSKQSNLPIEDLRELWRDLPQKGKVTLSPTQLSVQKIMDYNARFNRESEVEKLYKAKMAETQK